ncbi:hypothetical protein AURDEDRAFT_182652 [Auricularia subglabra TFB-10046 SS5]|nr:hypothetical protein AURDEDRAFT_182652 [Auricularia subglabra TFB-10046 SS5]
MSQLELGVQKIQQVLALLAGISSFGAGLAFSSYYTAKPTEPSDVLALLSWSYAAFLFCTITTLVWQVALNSSATSFQGHLFRSNAGISLALNLAAVSIASGSILLTVSLVRHAPRGVQASGYAVIAAIGVLGASGLMRISGNRLDRLSYVVALRNTQYGTEKEREEVLYDQMSRFLDQHLVHGASLATLRSSVDNFDYFPFREQAVRLICCSKAYRRRGKGIAWHPQHEPDISAAVDFIKRSKQWGPIVELMNGKFEYEPRWMQMCLLRMMHDAICTEPGWQLACMLVDGAPMQNTPVDDEDLAALAFLQQQKLVDPFDGLSALRKKVPMFDKLALDEQARRLVWLRRANSEVMYDNIDDTVSDAQLNEVARYIELWHEWGQSAKELPKSSGIETLPQRARRLRLLRAAYHGSRAAPLSFIPRPKVLDEPTFESPSATLAPGGSGVFSNAWMQDDSEKLD